MREYSKVLGVRLVRMRYDCCDQVLDDKVDIAKVQEWLIRVAMCLPGTEPRRGEVRRQHHPRETSRALLTVRVPVREQCGNAQFGRGGEGLRGGVLTGENPGAGRCSGPLPASFGPDRKISHKLHRYTPVEKSNNGKINMLGHDETRSSSKV